jgi:hypothetical protein
MREHPKIRTLGWTLLVLTVVVALETAVIWWANVTAWGFFNLSARDQLQLTSTLTIGTVTTFALLFGVLVYVGIDDILNRRTLSALYFPALAIMGLIVAILTPTTILSIDLLLHDLQPRWRFTAESELMLWQRFLFVLLCGAGAWFTLVVVMGRDWPKTQVILVAAVLVALVVAVVTYPILA